MIENTKSIKPTTKKFINYLFSRLNEDEFQYFVFWQDDKNNPNKHLITGYKTDESQIDYSLMYKYNEDDTFAAGFALNPLSDQRRTKENVTRILNIAIDIDNENGADEESFAKIGMFLLDLEIDTVLEDKSQNGYHFIIPVLMQTDEEHIVEKFLKRLRDEVHPDVDTVVFDKTRFFRLPETLNNKSKPGTRLITITDNLEINKERLNLMIDTNTKAVIKYAEGYKGKLQQLSERPTINEYEQQEPDVFFHTLLRDEKIQNEFSSLDDVQKNNVIFKNLAIYIKYHEEDYNKATDLVELCGHQAASFDGWLNKSMTNVNYKEVDNLIHEKNIKCLIQPMQLQMQKVLSILKYFTICNIDEEKHYKYVMLDNLTGTKTYLTSKTLPEALWFKSLQGSGHNIIDEMKISRKGEKGDLSHTTLMNSIMNRLHDMTENYNIITNIVGFRYAPGQDKIFKIGKEVFANYYSPGEFDYETIVSAPYHFPTVKAHLMHLCVDEKSYEYFNKWLAYLIQNPGKKLPTCMIFMGSQGTGKGVMKKFILDRIFGFKNVANISQKTLESKWGDVLEGKRIIVADEVSLNKKMSGSAIEILKSYISEETLTIDLKGRDSRQIKNHTHWIFTTNKEHPVTVELWDRRYNVFEQDKPIDSTLFDHYDTEEGEKEFFQYYCYLKTLKVSYHDVDHPISTNARNVLIDASKENIFKFMDDVFLGDDFSYIFSEVESTPIPYAQINTIPAKRLHDVYIKWCTSNGYKSYGTKAFGNYISKKFSYKSEVKKDGQQSIRSYVFKNFKKKYLKKVNKDE